MLRLNKDDREKFDALKQGAINAGRCYVSVRSSDQLFLCSLIDRALGVADEAPDISPNVVEDTNEDEDI